MDGPLQAFERFGKVQQADCSIHTDNAAQRRGSTLVTLPKQLANVGQWRNYDLARNDKRILALLPAEFSEAETRHQEVIFLENFIDDLRQHADAGVLLIATHPLSLILSRGLSRIGTIAGKPTHRCLPFGRD